MTVQYEGNGYYTVFIGSRDITLSLEEIEEIQSYDFTRNVYTDSVTYLQDRIEDLELQISDFQWELDRLQARS